MINHLTPETFMCSAAFFRDWMTPGGDKIPPPPSVVQKGLVPCYINFVNLVFPFSHGVRFLLYWLKVKQNLVSFKVSHPSIRGGDHGSDGGTMGEAESMNSKKNPGNSGQTEEDLWYGNILETSPLPLDLLQSLRSRVPLEPESKNRQRLVQGQQLPEIELLTMLPLCLSDPSWALWKKITSPGHKKDCDFLSVAQKNEYTSALMGPPGYGNGGWWIKTSICWKIPGHIVSKGHVTISRAQWVARQRTSVARPAIPWWPTDLSTNFWQVRPDRPSNDHLLRKCTEVLGPTLKI